MTEVDLYLEAHITIEPVFDENRTMAGMIGSKYGFKLAHLLMQKRKLDTPERSKHDTFMTGHSKNTDDIVKRTQDCVIELKENGFKVWRYKIENTLIDSRNRDLFELVSENAPQLPAIMCDQCVRS